VILVSGLSACIFNKFNQKETHFFVVEIPFFEKAFLAKICCG
jgi:hypothetical protein